MKKLLFLVAFAVVGSIGYSQSNAKISFTKGGVEAGKFTTSVKYEDFVEGIIKLKATDGSALQFVKADFQLTNPSGKKLSYSLTQPYFLPEQGGEVARASHDGATYTFTNIIAKDKAGKEYKLDKVVFEFSGFKED